MPTTRYTTAVLIVLTSACASTRDASRRPLSPCAKQLVDQKFLPESETAKAADYCAALTAAQLDCAKKEYLAHPDAPFVVSKACSTTGVAMAPVVVAAPIVVAKAPEPVVVEPPPVVEQPPVVVAEEAPAETDVIMLATADESLSTFVHLLDVAGLTKTILSASAVTLLAPTNEALAKMPHLADNKQRLRTILSRHVLLEIIATSDAPQGSRPPRRLKPLAGKPLPMHAGRDGVVTVGRAKVVRADVAATHGYLDVVDAVLLP